MGEEGFLLCPNPEGSKRRAFKGLLSEGVNTTKLVKVHADSMGIYMPLLSSLHAILFEGCPIRETVRKMMSSTHNVDVEME